MNAIIELIFEFTTFLQVFALIVYIIGVFIECNTCTIKDVEVHDGGFLNMGYSTNSNRELTTKDIRKATLWPIFVIHFFARTTLGIIHTIFANILLFFGCQYKQSNRYKQLDEFLWY